MGAPPPGAPPLPGGPPPPPGGDMAALLAAAGGPPEGGMAPGGPPPGAGPMMGPDGQPIPLEGLPPVQMYRGGEVKHFYDGSPDPDEEEDDATLKNSFGNSPYTAEQVANARSRLMSLMDQQELPEPDLEDLALKREKLYTKLLGDDKESQQAQLLFALAQKGLQFAGNVDAQGRPLRGSAVSRFATVASELPGEINKFISDTDKRRNAIRLAALEAAEKEATNIRERNVKLVEAKRRAYGDLVRRGAGESYPASKWFMRTVYTPGILKAWSDGALPSDDDARVEQAVNSLVADAKGRIVKEPYKDSMNRDQVRDVLIPGYKLPRAVQEAIDKRAALVSSGWRPLDTSQTSGALIGDDAATLPTDETTLEGGVAPTDAIGAPTVAPTAGTAPPVTFAPNRTLWERAPNLTDIDVVEGVVAQNVPMLGSMNSQAQVDQRFFTQQVNNLVAALQQSPRYAEGEREDIKRELKLNLSALRDTDAIRNNFMGVYQVLRQELEDARRDEIDPNLSGDFRKQRQMNARMIDDFLKVLMPPPIYYTDPNRVNEYKRLPIGSRFLRQQEDGEWVMDTRKRLPGE